MPSTEKAAEGKIPAVRPALHFLPTGLFVGSLGFMPHASRSTSPVKGYSKIDTVILPMDA